MKQTLILLLFFSFSPLASDIKYSFGYGALTSGVGARLSVTEGQNTAFISTGCWNVFAESLEGNACGGTFGLQSSYLFPGNNHTFGLAYGNLDYEVDPVTGADSTIYGVSINYSYFMNGMGESGAWIGAGYGNGSGDYKDISEVFLNIGYQF
ncbi:hypothetical protein J1N51_10845 [Psychrosphaera ytuae]|uniref:Outer membrane protein beta-barrel domain-containing protein n=1 Tax=Psychrosphaera ytuae TaxID=2820710 RepID=A0A975DAG5_9GAMM|nr:hypothetical protein [Psychrosphaera ytuae]QTH63233.1 hypothetical protein J1N51_10845 [Psychrosphaera ytuae]